MDNVDKVQNNFGEANIEFISKPFKMTDEEKSNKEFTMIQENVPCKVTPAITAMGKSANFLLM